MHSWLETISLTRPLRDVVAVGLPPETWQHDPGQRAAWENGFEKGRLEGEKAMNAQLVKQRGELHSLVQGTLHSLRQAVPQVVRDTENMVIALALEVARKLVADLPITAPMVEAAVRDALTHVESTAQVTVRLHPADLELLQGAGSPLLTSAEDGQSFRFLSSMDVTRGGCMVETRFGTVDARRETKFDLLKKGLIP
jgi:flagellar assembly protein FliH